MRNQTERNDLRRNLLLWKLLEVSNFGIHTERLVAILRSAIDTNVVLFIHLLCICLLRLVCKRFLNVLFHCDQQAKQNETK